MNLRLALAVAKQHCDKTHPATIASNKVAPLLRMILVSNGQYITSQSLDRARKHWTFEEFVQQFGEQVTTATTPNTNTGGTTLLTSLMEIYSFNPCRAGWGAILRGRGKTQADSELFPLANCLQSNNFSDVCWLLGKRKKEISIVARAAKLCAESVAQLANSYSRRAASASASASASAYSRRAAADAAAAAAAYVDADAAAAAAYAAAAVAAAYAKQTQRNKNFLLQAIREYEANCGTEIGAI